MAFLRYRLSVAVLALAAHPGLGAAEPPAPGVLPAADLQADVALFRRAYETLHPGLYRYQSHAAIDADFRVLEQALSRDATLAAAFVAFSEFTAKIKCGHSYPNFFNQPDAVADSLFKNQDRLPFYFKWIDGRMIVTRDFSGDPDLRPGTEVTAINATPVTKVLERLLTVSRADGSNDAKRIANLEVTGSERFEAFDIYFPLLFPHPGPAITLQLIPYGADSQHPATVHVRALTYAERIAPIAAQEKARSGGNAPLWDSRFLPDGTAVLRMPTWDTYNSSWDWQASLSAFFDEIVGRSSPRLVIDLRGNEGGTDVGDAILAHLIRAPLRKPETVRLVRYRKVPPDLAPYVKTWDPSFKDWGARAVDLGNGFYSLSDPPSAAEGVIAPAAHPYTGEVFVLVDASNSSATFLFAQAVQQFKLGTLVGQPTGGNRRGINGGAFLFLHLPHSGIEIDIPLIGQYPVADQPDQGLIPDVRLSETVADIATGSDGELGALTAAWAAGRRLP